MINTPRFPSLIPPLFRIKFDFNNYKQEVKRISACIKLYDHEPPTMYSWLLGTTKLQILIV